MNFEYTKYELVKKSSLVLFVLVGLSTITFPVFAPQPIVFLYAGIGYLVLSGGLFCLIKYSQPNRIFPILVIGLGGLFLLPCLVISGGVNSQFSYMIPIIPIMAGLLSSYRITLACSVFSLLTIMGLHIFESHLPAYSGVSPSPDLSHIITFWLCMATLLTSFLGLEFEKLTRRLGLQLQQADTNFPHSNEIDKRSIHDYLQELVEQNKTRKQWVSVLIIDFVQYYTLIRHADSQFVEGCIQQLSKSLRLSLRNSLDVFARYDERSFVVILNAVDQSNTAKIAEKIQRSVESIEMTYIEDKVPLSVKIGYCCELTTDNTHAHLLINEAKEALEVAQQGNSKIVGSEESKLISSRFNSSS